MRRAVAARNHEVSNSMATETQAKSSVASQNGKLKPMHPKKDNKKLKGVVVKKKTSSSKETLTSTSSNSKSQPEDDQRSVKRQKTQ